MLKSKIVALIATGAVVLGAIGTGSATMPFDDTARVFVDIENHWAKPDIMRMYQAGIVKGVGEGKFAPEQAATREQVVTLILRSTGQSLDKTSTATFADVPVDRWSHPFIETALNRSIIAKGSTGKFEPEWPVRRAEAALWISRAVPALNTGVAGGNPAPFSDIGKLSSEEQSAISHVYHLGIMMGNSGLFRPDDSLTRAEMATLIARLFDRLQSHLGGQEMTFHKVDLSKASDELKNWAGSVKGTPGLHTKTTGGKTYILVSRGEKPNAGYGLTITKVIEEKNRVVVKFEQRNPEPGKMYAQVITTPFDLVEIAKTDKRIELGNDLN
ncbi:S-layer homology domain-containing protein [Effusibacillus lacus]|uniref:SLH domain-containing protein n=1 Tax=Effusibacillus lacus TaxID=1348429 RepID=A0A292YM06_9BACL|nr:S-layer homology domain-containing protein [Effusibacillus lacus]TCS72330.1 S-layer family protein [Effusibacillus lacus]GAX90206.1 hypothetical protein EFBL_1832 [Effusibacillus lacus]